jgi:hypothetical protein
MARIVPQTTGVIKGLNIVKHNAIRRAMTPIRIAISIAGPMDALSMAIFCGSLIRNPPVHSGIFIGWSLERYIFQIATRSIDAGIGIENYKKSSADNYL